MRDKASVAFILVLFMGFSWGPAGAALAAEPLTVTSPDGNLAISFELKSNPQPYLAGERAYYRVAYQGAPILLDSPLGLDFLGARVLDRDFEVVGTNRQSHDATWENAFGTKREVRDHYNELTVSLRERQAPGRRVDLIFRAYDEGVAFRYVLPKQGALEKFTLAAEGTGFYFARDVFPYALNLGSYTTPYESEYRRVSINEIKPTSIVGLPLLVEVPQGPWVALLEADLRDYAGMYVGGVPGIANALMSKLSPLPGRADQAVVGTTPKTTPWRVLLVSPRPGGLIESNYLILNLSAPCALADTSWIKPGKAVWPWWSENFARDVNFQPGNNTATNKHYIDFAAEHRFDYIEVAETWPGRDEIIKPIPTIDYAEIFGHARRRGVRILLWVPWVPLSKQIDKVLPLYKKWGVSGLKVDFMDRDDQEMVNFYEEVVRKAAQYQMLVYFHGAYKPTGLQRTYPNLITREGVMGLEYSKWTARVTPEHDVTLAFTRLLAGPMDYTPGGFRNATRGQFKPQSIEPMTQGTRAHQLAMYVIYEMPLAMVADYPASYRNQPGLEFIVKVPTVWDDTEVLGGEVGKYITVARRRGNAWYLGSMTNWDARDLEIPLDFLAGRGGSRTAPTGSDEFEAEIFADGADADKVATSLSITQKRVKSSDKLSVRLAPGGGLAVIFMPVRR